MGMPKLQSLARAIEEDSAIAQDTPSKDTPLPALPGKDASSWDNCNFEKAISATGYGRYNVLITVGSVFPILSCLFATSTISLVLPSADCDLSLNNFHKGILNASTYIGMICSAFFWGFLSDTLGRQKLLVISFAMDALLNLTAALAQSFGVLLAAKLMAGFICSGSYAMLMTYLAECHSAERRASIIQWTGVFTALGTVCLPLMAWGIIPRDWTLTLFEGALYLPSWRIFLIVCTIPSIVSAISFYLQFESPKFLMTQGRNEEAMTALRAIYARNSGNPASTFPVQSLIDEKKMAVKEKSLVEEEPKSKLRFLKLGWVQTKTLFLAPHRRHALLVFMIQGYSFFGLHTIRLWMPQLFASILANEHLASHVTSVCQLLVAPREPHAAHGCTSHVDTHVYINAAVIGLTTAVSYGVTTAACYLPSGSAIKALGNKWLIIGCTWVAVVACCSMYWATSSNAMLALASLFVAATSVSTTTVIHVIVDLFPTTLRTMAVSLTMMCGRIGAMTGNLVFPLLLDWDCAIPFFLIAALLNCAGLIVFALPKTEGKAME